MVVEEQHRRDDDVAATDIGNAAVERAGIAVPVGSSVEADGNARAVLGEARGGPLGGARQVVVERNDHDVQGRGASGHNAPWRRTVCRG